MDTEVSMINNIINMTDSTTPHILTGIGERLKTTRESMQLSQKEAAARLYLNVKIIELIENEAFNEGPPATFMRGYLNSYARLLSFPEDEINAALKQLESNLPIEREAPPPILKVRAFYPTERYLPWTTAGVIFILVLLVSMWWRSHSKYEIADVPAKTSLTETNLTAPQITPVINPVNKAPVTQNTKNITETIPPPPPLLARPSAITASSTPTTQAPLALTKSRHHSHKRYRKTKSSKRTKNIVMSLPEPN